MSDHISGPRALADPIADITDVYAFPSPERPGSLVLVLEHVADGQALRPVFRRPGVPVSATAARPLAAAGSGGQFVPGKEEFVLDCVFDGPGGVDDQPRVQQGRCLIPSGKAVAFTVNDVEGGSEHGLRVFAGVRWDPFIMDAPAALKTIATRKLAFTDPGSIFLDGKNVLSIVAELEPGLLPDWTLVGVVAETLTRGPLNVRIERVGRPEVKNMMLAPKEFDPVNRDLEIRDLYNMEDAFHLADAYQGAYRARLDANLAFWDGLDGKVDWLADSDGRHPLTALVLADFLVVDVTKPYLEYWLVPGD